MMRPSQSRRLRWHSRAIVAVAMAASVSSASAAVTVRGAVPEDGPRLGWFDRYSEARQGPEQVDKVSQSIKVGDGASLDLSHLAGDIRVTAGGTSEIRIDATKRVRSHDAEEARRVLATLRVDINTFNNRVEIRTTYPRRGQFGGNISAIVDYVITVPPSAVVALKSISGDISVRDIGTQNTLVLTSVSGSVLGTGLKVRALEAGSVSGNVRLVGSEVERLEAKSVSGNIEFDAPLTKGGRYEFASHSGNVRILLSGNTGFELDADTFSGNVRSDVPMTLRSVGAEDGRNRRGSNRAIRGSVGDASAYLAIRSHSGSVVISRK